MAETTSLSFPYMFDVARNRVSVVEDNASIVNRTRLLILTEPTELYNNPDFGVGLKRYLWKYNTPNTSAEIQDRMRDQFRKYEPYVDASSTQFAPGLISTHSDNAAQQYNQLDMSVGLRTVFGDDVNISLNDGLNYKKLID